MPGPERCLVLAFLFLGIEGPGSVEASGVELLLSKPVSATLNTHFGSGSKVFAADWSVVFDIELSVKDNDLDIEGFLEPEGPGADPGLLFPWSWNSEPSYSEVLAKKASCSLFCLFFLAQDVNILQTHTEKESAILLSILGIKHVCQTLEKLQDMKHIA